MNPRVSFLNRLVIRQKIHPKHNLKFTNTMQHSKNIAGTKMAYEWILPIAGFVLSLIGTLFGMFKYLVKLIYDGDKELHHRINDVKEKYVTQQAFDKSLHNIEKSLDSLEKGISESNDRFDKILNHILKNKDEL